VIWDDENNPIFATSPHKPTISSANPKSQAKSSPGYNVGIMGKGSQKSGLERGGGCVRVRVEVRVRFRVRDMFRAMGSFASHSGSLTEHCRRSPQR